MDTLNAIAENIAYQLGDQFNTTLKESIKDTLIIYRSKFLRDSDTHNFDDMALFAQELSLELITVNLYDELGLGTLVQNLNFITNKAVDLKQFKVLRTKNKVPKPLRHKMVHRELFKFVGSFEGDGYFHYTTLPTFKYDCILPNRENTIFYIYVKEYVYIINNLKHCTTTDAMDLKELFISSIFDDPRKAYSICSDSGVFIDDRPFPMSGDLLASIQNMVKKGEFIPGYTKDGQAINIKPDRQDDK